MATDDLSPERRGAMFKWHKAQQEMKKGHKDQALELARAGVEEDPGFVDLRLWIVNCHVNADEQRKAVHQLEEIIHVDKENEEAWGLLERLDRQTAERLKRLQSIAPDPFVSKRTKPLSEDVVDMGEFYDDDDDDAVAARPVGGDPFVSHGTTDDVLDDWGDEGEEDEQDEQDEEEMEDLEEETAEAAAGPPAWEYEQDRPYLAKWAAEKIVISIVASIQEKWDEIEEWEEVLALCAHATPSLHEKIFRATETACKRLGVEMPELFVVPERCMHPVLIKCKPAALAVPTGVLRAMNDDEALFQVGREIGHLNTGYLAEMQAVKIITNRRAQLAGDLASTLRDFLGAEFTFWDQGVPQEERDRLKKLGHAWQQRCELTADRAGLICCGDVTMACTAIAKTTGRSIDAAAEMTIDSFLKQFEGQDVGQLAAIPVQESPSRNAQYAAYRIHMLKWWATTPAGIGALTS